MASLIPGLTDDVAAKCLSRIPLSEFQTVSQVCWRWRRFLRSDHYAAVRKLSGSVKEFMCVQVNSMSWVVFDGSGNKLGQMPPVPGSFNLFGSGLTVLDDRKIVFLGGKYLVPVDVREPVFPNGASADVYEFNPATNRWRKLADMNIPRYDFGYAVVDGLLYVIGGYSSDDVRILNAEVYNPKTNEWSLMDCPDRPDFRRPAFAFSFNSKLFVVGKESRFIDIYDPKTKTWEVLNSGQSLLVYSYTVVGNRLYFMNVNMLKMGEFDPETNSWSSVDVPLGHPRQNNKAVLRKVERTLFHEPISGHLDSRDQMISLSDFYATSVLINF